MHSLNRRNIRTSAFAAILGASLVIGCGVQVARGFSASDLQSIAIGGDLGQGSQGARVTLLQQFLVSETAANPSIYPEGKVTGYFGPLTVKALGRFQTAHGISPASGYLGSKTKKFLVSYQPASGTSGPTTAGGTAAILSALRASLPAVTSVSTSALNVIAEAHPLPEIPASDVQVSSIVAADRGTYLGQVLVAAGKETAPANVAAGGTLNGLVDDLAAAYARHDNAALGTLTASAADWKRYADQVYARLRDTAIAPAFADDQRTLLAWLKYASGALEALSAPSGGMDANAAARLAADYHATYTANSAAITKEFSPSNQAPLFSLAKSPARFTAFGVRVAHAETPPPPFFGGQIKIKEKCSNGKLAEVVSEPGLGGTYMFPILLAIIDPISWSNLKNGSWAIGSALPLPSPCIPDVTSNPFSGGTPSGAWATVAVFGAN